MRTFPAVFAPLALLAPIFLFGCSDATGSLVGGDTIDTGAPATVTPPADDGGGPTTNLTSADCLDGGAHAGSRWSDLYTCYFGPTGPDSCSGTGTSCHADSQSAGGSIWPCGATKDTCYAGMTGYAPLDPRAGMANPTMNHLYTVLCGTPSGSGVMPFLCPPGTTLYSDDFKRIADWIAAGAPNN